MDRGDAADGLVRAARADDADAVFALARVLARTFTPRREAFDTTFERVGADPGSELLVAVLDDEVVGYLLGFRHRAFFANGTVGWVEELVVREDVRGRALGSRLVAEFEDHLRRHDGVLVALATTRAGAFYETLSYEHEAAYYRKVL